MCRLEKPIEPMTKLEVSLELPVPPREDGTSLLQRIHCAGVVVRQNRLVGQGAARYETAVYFSDIRPEDRRRIGEFVLRSMLEHDRRRS